MLMALLDTFMFELKPNSRDAVDFSGIDISEDYRYVTHSKIDAHDTYQDVKKYGVKITLKGDLVLKKIHAIDPISQIAKEKREVVFVLGTGEVYMVKIDNIKKGRSIMDADGKHFRQNYTIEMTEVLE